MEEALTWFREMLEWQQDTSESDEFMEFLPTDLFQLSLSRDPERRIEIEWAAENGDRFLVGLSMEGTDRRGLPRGLLSDVAKAIAYTGTDIQHADMKAVQGGMAGGVRGRGAGPLAPEVGPEGHRPRERRDQRRVARELGGGEPGGGAILFGSISDP